MPPFHPSRTRHALARRAAAAAVVTTLGLAVAGCSGSDSSTPHAAPSSAAPSGAAPAVRTNVTIGKVAGTIRRPYRKNFFHHRQHLRKHVGDAVDRWLDGGFVGVHYPRSRFPRAFASFTADAKHDARRQKRLMTNWKWRHKIDGVTVKHRSVALDVLAPRGRPAGVTARVHLVFTTSGHHHKRISVGGRLFLARDHHGDWRIFGYDVAKGAK